MPSSSSSSFSSSPSGHRTTPRSTRGTPPFATSSSKRATPVRVGEIGSPRITRGAPDGDGAGDGSRSTPDRPSQPSTNTSKGRPPRRARSIMIALSPGNERGPLARRKNLWLRGADAVEGERHAGAAVDHLEVADLDAGEIARAEQAVPLGGGVRVGLGGERDVAAVGQEHAVLLQGPRHHPRALVGERG